MGTPTSEITQQNLAQQPPGIEPQMSWEAYEYSFTAFFDVNDRVRELQVNDLYLSQAEKAGIHCPSIRVAP